MDPRYLDGIKGRLGDSRGVLLDCCLPDGAIVAANSSESHYPKEAKDYRFVWPRDASYVSLALDALGLKGPQERFFDWCARAEGFKEMGVFLENYHPDGRIRRYDGGEMTTKWGAHFQPDQTGSVLFAIWHHFKDDPSESAGYSDLIQLAADGLCRLWNGKNFEIITQDLWETWFTFPDLEDNFTYTLAACSRGLRCAHEMLGDKRWLQVSKEMKKRLDKHYRGYFYRSYGKVSDSSIDASALGLVYPFGVYEPDDGRVLDTVREIESRLVGDYGVHRFEGDSYDGWMYKNIHRRKGGGSWPVLNFLMALYYARLGERARVKRYFDLALHNVGRHIPEQIFNNKYQKCPSPLAWSHAMFVLAAGELDYL